MLTSLRHRLAEHGPWPRRMLALACLALAAVTAVPHRGSVRAGASVAVAVAARPMPAGQLLGRADLSVRHVPRGTLPRSQLLAVPRLVGRRLAGPVAAGEPIGPLRLVGSTLTASLGPDLVAVGLTVDDVHLPEFVHAGERVDVVAAVPEEAGLGATGDGAEGSPTSGHGGGDASAPGGGADASVPAAPVVARAVRVLAVLPGTAADLGSSGGDQPEVVVAASRPVAARLATIRGNGPVSVFASSP